MIAEDTETPTRPAKDTSLRSDVTQMPVNKVSVMDINSGSPKFPITAEELVSIVNFDNRDKPEQLRVLDAQGGVEGIAKSLRTPISTGLSNDSAELQARREVFGANKLPPPHVKSFLELVWNGLQDLVLRILILGSLITLIVGSIQDPSTGWHEGIAIAVTVLIVVGCSSANDWSKERKFRKIMMLSQQKKTKVLRGGVEQQVWVHEIVVGDVVLLAMGDEIPADGLFAEGTEVTIDESPLTGETQPVKKSPKEPLLFSGCQVSEGSCHMLVTTVGRLSTGGQIQELLNQESHRTTPLQEKLGKLAILVSKYAAVLSILTWLALMGWWAKDVIEKGWKSGPYKENGQDKKSSGLLLVDHFVVAVTLLVVAVPDGLPLATTISLANAMSSMIREQNFVRHLDASETMGEATCICSDKTGTLTENRMTVVKGWIGRQEITAAEVTPQTFAPDLRSLVVDGIALNSTCFIDFDKNKNNQMIFVGSKTEGALLVFANKLGGEYKAIRMAYNKVEQYAFTSDRKRMSTVVSVNSKFWRLFTKGASEIVLGLCTHYVGEGGSREVLDAATTETLRNTITAYASDGYRTITLAYRDLEVDPAALLNPDYVESDLTLLGIVGIKDPVRQEVPAAVAACQKAGIMIRMVTGDNILTAKKIAQECGILTAGGIALEGPVFRALSNEEKDRIIPNLQVLARSSPADKYILVTRLKLMGEVVAVTGDGTNDAPALKEADIGFSMGITGTDIAKNASDIILLDDNFGSIQRAVLWGRNVFACINKFLQFQFAINLTSVLLTLIAAATNKGTPLNAVMLLWINLIMDTLGALAMSTEKPTDDMMEEPPHRKGEPVLSGYMKTFVLAEATWQLFVLLFFLYYGYRLFGIEDSDTIKIVTIVFNINILMQLVNETIGRLLKFEWNLFKGIFRNKYFVPILVAIFCIQVILVTFGGDFVGCVRLGIRDWVGCIIVALIGFPMGWIIPTLYTIIYGSPKRQLPRTTSASALSISMGDVTKVDMTSTLISSEHPISRRAWDSAKGNAVAPSP
mmetsp:Transcript_16307/g.26923  ORF Transcript_16307/g.26923 Transcript_16307/m.26923 type:complete len:1033 (-) Transcript_16307:210-3308(-)